MASIEKVTDREFIKGELPTSRNGKIIWKESPGKKFSIRYNYKKYDFVVKKYDNTNRLVYFDYNGSEYHMYTSALIKCNIGLIAGLLTMEFAYNIGDIVNGYEILKQVREKKKNGKSYRAYTVKCLADGYNHNVAEDSLKKGEGCPVCINKTVLKGVNDIWTTAPEIAKLLKNPEDGHCCTIGSNKRLDWLCPDCNQVVPKIQVHLIKKYGRVPCKTCSDGFSYPEKMMNNIFKQLQVEYKYHYRIPDAYFLFHEKKYYPEFDFYFETDNEKILLELDGGFHFKTHSSSELTLDDVVYIDNNKTQLAITKGYKIIRIDCQNSNYDYIFNNLVNSELSNYYNFSSIDKNMVNTYAYSNLIKQVCEMFKYETVDKHEIARKFGITYDTVYKYLLKGEEMGWCRYDPKNWKYSKFLQTTEVIL